VSAARGINLAAGQLVTGPGVFKGLIMTAGAAATATIYDNTSGSGTVITVAQLGAAGTVVDTPMDGVFFATGLFAVLTGSPSGTVRV
jgi:hypothetical protein